MKTPIQLSRRVMTGRARGGPIRRLHVHNKREKTVKYREIEEREAKKKRERDLNEVKKTKNKTNF